MLSKYKAFLTQVICNSLSKFTACLNFFVVFYSENIFKEMKMHIYLLYAMSVTEEAIEIETMLSKMSQTWNWYLKQLHFTLGHKDFLQSIVVLKV